MARTVMICLLVLMSAITGCSINHPIAKDYNQYLSNNLGQSGLPRTPLETNYQLAQATRDHRYEFRAAVVGYAHLWIVEFGKVLSETLESQEVQRAFGRLTPLGDKDAADDYLISFSLQNYEFKNFRAYIDLHITLTRGEDSLLDKTYQSEGGSQGGKMFWGGPFAMKNATQQSTKLALDKILGDLIDDLNRIGQPRRATN